MTSGKYIINCKDTHVHLGSYIPANITDRNIVGHVCDLYQRSNSVISDM